MIKIGLLGCGNVGRIIATHAESSPGVTVQSVGGGGGHGSYAVDVAAGKYFSA